MTSPWAELALMECTRMHRFPGYTFCPKILELGDILQGNRPNIFRWTFDVPPPPKGRSIPESERKA